MTDSRSVSRWSADVVTRQRHVQLLAWTAGLAYTILVAVAAIIILLGS